MTAEIKELLGQLSKHYEFEEFIEYFGEGNIRDWLKGTSETTSSPEIANVCRAMMVLARKQALLESALRLVCEELEKTVFVPSPFCPFDEKRCGICRKEINRGDRCYDHGAEIYTCSKKCADKYESREPAFSSKDYTTRS